MPPTPSDTTERARLARSLRDLRQRAGIGGVVTSKRAGISQSKLSKLENGQLRPTSDDIRVLCDVYGASSEERDDLQSLAQSLRGESRLSRVVLSRGAARLQQRIGRLESRAHLLRSFQPAMIIGLLQTADYARTVIGDVLDPGEVEATVAARVGRRTVLDDETKECVLVMSEGALRWQVGSPALMAAQVDSLIEVTRRPNVRLGIVPWTTAVTVTCTHGFHMYDDAAVVFGTETASGVLDDADDVVVYSRLFQRIEQVASFGDEARRELARIGSDYRLLA